MVECSALCTYRVTQAIKIEDRDLLLDLMADINVSASLSRTSSSEENSELMTVEAVQDRSPSRSMSFEDDLAGDHCRNRYTIYKSQV